LSLNASLVSFVFTATFMILAVLPILVDTSEPLNKVVNDVKFGLSF